MKNSYNVFFVEEQGCYVFVTEHQITYEIRLEKRPELMDGYPNIQLNLIELSFAPVNTQKPTADKRIEATIIQFLSEYFSEQTNALVVVYESLDSKQEGRHLLFAKWFARNTPEDYLEKVNFSINMYDGLDVKGLFIFRADHPQHDEILKMVDAIVKDMQSLK